MLVKKASRAIELTNPEHIYFVWLQGESDAIAHKSKDEYKKQMTELFENLKQDLGVEKFGNILVGRYTMEDSDLEIINAQKEVCRENDGFLMLTEITEEIVYIDKYMNPEAQGHYSVDGQELIGLLAGKKLGDYCNKLGIRN